MDRVEWESLPAPVRDLAQEHLGTIVKVEPIREGRRSALAALAHTKTGRAFLKAAPVDDTRAAAQLTREASLAPHLTALAPALLCDIKQAGWRLLGFEHVQGHRATYAPGSPDLPAVLETIAVLDQLAVPDEVELMWFESRWSTYAPAPRELVHLAGGTLLHTDLNPGNVLIGPHRATLVDWGMASRGAAFVNPADLVVNLIACGHTPRDAETTVADLHAWRDSDPEVIDFYARTVASTWLQALWSYTHPWARAVVAAAQRWALYRQELR
ncbi:phosphotransferase [Actinomadura fibrosa]|uniref:Phosphotransferase n=1 Tax=Actinomadura fibrosa TaxID=111802 RepID=A0ABW2XQH6_9ACTN|nr:phosphotransferase [Actinomadura fibrosa]